MVSNKFFCGVCGSVVDRPHSSGGRPWMGVPPEIWGLTSATLPTPHKVCLWHTRFYMTLDTVLIHPPISTYGSLHTLVQCTQKSMQNLVIFFQSANISLSASMCTCRDERRRSKWLTTAAINTQTWKLAVAAFHVRVLFLALTGRICWKDSLLPHVRITLTNHRAWHSIPGTNCLDNKSVQLG